MDTLAMVVVVASLSGLILAVGWTIHGLWRIVMREDRPVLVYRMLEHLGLSMNRFLYPAEVEQFATATRRCLMCRDRATCLAWLERDGKTGYEAFCPNADFISKVRTAVG
jgi:hypothetical protein